MKKIIILFTLFITTFTFLYADSEIKISGTYQGDNLYVMNPFAPSGVGFCIFEVTVNDEISTDEINSSAFEIDLSVYSLNIGDKVEIIIKHKDGCNPKILNPEVLKPKSTFSIKNITLDKTGKLKWTTTGESGELPFIVEQFKWKKWVKIEEIKGKGTPSIHSYSCMVSFHSGENKFRVKQKDHSNKARYSKEVTFRNLATAVTFIPGKGKRTTKWLIFSAITEYEIYDYYGKLQKKNKGIKVDVSGLDNGTYFLNYDNKTETFIKR